MIRHCFIKNPIKITVQNVSNRVKNDHDVYHVFDHDFVCSDDVEEISYELFSEFINSRSKSTILIDRTDCDDKFSDFLEKINVTNDNVVINIGKDNKNDYRKYNCVNICVDVSSDKQLLLHDNVKHVQLYKSILIETVDLTRNLNLRSVGIHETHSLKSIITPYGCTKYNFTNKKQVHPFIY